MSDRPVPAHDDVESIFPGSGDLAALMRAKDWTQTPLGPLGSWPQSLRTAVGMMLPSPQPCFIFWGPEHAMLYNDAGLPILGAKHPEDLGQCIKEALKEAWPVLGPLVRGVIDTGTAVYFENLLIPLRRFGFLQDGYCGGRRHRRGRHGDDGPGGRRAPARADPGAVDPRGALSERRRRPPGGGRRARVGPGRGALRAHVRAARGPRSARAGEEATVEGLAAGADDYIVKPFGARELLARVEGALRTATVERARRAAQASQSQ